MLCRPWPVLLTLLPFSAVATGCFTEFAGPGTPSPSATQTSSSSGEPGATSEASLGSSGPTSPSEPASTGPDAPEPSSSSSPSTTSSSSSPPRDDDTSGGTTGPGQQEVCAGANRILFINFDGVVLTAGAEDASGNVTAQQALARRWSPYTGSDRAEVLERVALLFEPFELCVTDERPLKGPYDMVLATDDEVYGSVGFPSQFDCDDRDGSNSIGVSPTGSAFSKHPAWRKGNAIALLVGWALGLEPVETPDDLMARNPFATDENTSFFDGCLPLSQRENCAAPSCSPNNQNSFARLEAVLGLRSSSN